MPYEAAVREQWCTLRVSSKGMYVNGENRTRDAAVAACRTSAGAMVVLDDNAAPEMWKEIEAQLRRRDPDARHHQRQRLHEQPAGKGLSVAQHYRRGVMSPGWLIGMARLIPVTARPTSQATLSTRLVLRCS